MQAPNGSRFLNLVFLISIKDRAKHIINQRKPWEEFCDYTSFKIPKAWPEALEKTNKNVHYFKVNYFLWMVCILAATMLWTPSSIVSLLVVLAAWLYVFIVRTEPLVIGGKELNEREKVILLGCGTFVFVFYVTKTGAVLFTGLMVGLAGVLAHAAVKVPDEMFLYEEGNMGFFSFLHGPK